MSTYCAIADVYSWLPRGVVQRPARLVSSVSTTADSFTLDDHGLADDDPVTLRAESGGALPTGVSAGVTYFAIVLTPATFQLAASAGGVAIALSGASSNVLAIAGLPWDRWIEEESATIDCTVPSHVVPFATTPAIVRKYTAALVAKRAAISCGVATPMLDVALEKTVYPEFVAWRNGASIRGSAEPPSAQVPQLWTGTSAATTRVIT